MNRLKNQLFLITILSVLIPAMLFAQGFQGVANYEVVKNLGKMSIQLDDASPEMKAQIADIFRKQALKEFMLSFNTKESSWVRINGPLPSLKYKDIANSLYLEEASLIGEGFLIEDKIPHWEWVLTDETKKIGVYTARKATSQRIWESYSQVSDMVTDTVAVEAWFIPEIPVPLGPDIYGGLPGLILELEDGKATYRCINVKMNPEEIVKIVRPSNGRKVSREEYKRIRIAMRNEIIKGLGGK